MNATDRKSVKEIKILLSAEKADERMRSLFKDFRSEMKKAGVECSLRVLVDSKVKSAFHDRWIISKRKRFNLPSPDTLARNQFSEIKPTTNDPPFDDWWKSGLDIIDDWNNIHKA